MFLKVRRVFASVLIEETGAGDSAVVMIGEKSIIMIVRRRVRVR